jgi:PAS domain S-box-containing protein
MDVIGYTAKEVLDMGPNFLLLTMHPDDLAMLPQAGAEYYKRKDGEVFEQTFRMRHKNGQWRWVHRSATIFSRTPDGQPKQILGACTDITEFKKTERELQELSGRLLSIQDEERRRIARELHDVTGQNLAAIGFHLGALERSEGLSAHAKNTLAECLKLCVESQKEIRTLSYLLHPPLLDPFGLVRALEWYIDGLRKRTRMEVILDVTEDIGRLPIELETDLFRVIQEGLTNSFRHAGSDLTIIRLAMKEGGGGIVLQIEDQGGPKARTKLNERGVDAGFGVGIPGMRERLRQHGGTLEISASDLGTTLTVFVPLRPGAQSRKAGENAT